MNQKYTEVAVDYFKPVSKTINMTVKSLSALLILLLIACGGSNKESTTPAPPAANNAPIAQAGADQVASVTVSVLLDGSASTDADNDTLTYAWSFTDQPATSQSILDGSTLAQPNFTPDVAGTYTITLTVSDGTDTSPADQVVITVSNNSVAQVIGAAGGVLVSADGLVTLTIPSGALTNNENISITKVTIDQQNSYLGSEFNEIDDIQAAYDLRPEGLVFDTPITVTLQAEGNPVIDETTMGGPFQILSSSNGTLMEILDDLTLRADADTGNVVLQGALGHFSPLVYIYNSDFDENLGFWKIAGVPDAIDLEATTVITASASSLLFILSAGTYIDNDSQPPFQNDSTMDISLDGTGEALSGEITYRCNEAGEASYSGRINVTVDSPLFAPNRGFGVVASKQVTCVPVTPPPSARLQTGINPAPSGLTSIESLQIGKFVNLLLFANTVAQANNDLIALFSGIQGWSIYNLITNTLVAESIDQSRTDPVFGAHLAAYELANGNVSGMILRYGTGTFGSTQCNYDSETQTIFNFCQLSQGTGFDAVSVGNSYNTTQVAYATSTRAGVIELNPQTEFYERIDFASPGTISGTARSAVRANTTGPLLVLSQFGSTARLSLVDPDGTVTIAGSLPGEDARKLRCLDNLCVLTVFDDGSGNGTLRLIDWNGTTAPTIVDTPITVGNGPVNTDLILLANGNYLIVSTGFNDNTITLTEVTSAGVEVSSNTNPAPTGCSQPAHAVFYIPSAVAEEAQVLGTCFATDNYFVLNIVAGSAGFEIVSLP